MQINFSAAFNTAITAKIFLKMATRANKIGAA